jgi:hypothetical protein
VVQSIFINSPIQVLILFFRSWAQKKHLISALKWPPILVSPLDVWTPQDTIEQVTYVKWKIGARI